MHSTEGVRFTEVVNSGLSPGNESWPAYKTEQNCIAVESNVTKWCGQSGQFSHLKVMLKIMVLG